MNLLGKRMVETLGFVVAAMILCISPASAWSAEDIDIRYLVQGKKVIPVSCRIGDWEITDIKLPELVVTNRRETPVTVEKVDVIGRSPASRRCASGSPGSRCRKRLAGPPTC